MDQPRASESELMTLDGAMAAAPQAVYKTLRASGRMFQMADDAVVLTRRADIDEAFRQPEIISSDSEAMNVGNIRPLIPLQIDPPEHKKFRKLLDPIFAPKRMAVYEESLTALVNELIDQFAERGTVDVAQEFTVPFPSRVFLTMLGLPVEELPRFLAMKDGIIRPHLVTGTEWNSEAMLRHRDETAASIYEYFDGVLDDRVQQRRDDLLSYFLDGEVDGRRLSREDILDICFLFLVAGLDTVSATLDCMFAYLAQHPEQRERLVAEPDLIPAAIEELLRWETPVMGVVRVAKADTEVSGCPIRKGSMVVVLLGSANTDEEEQPDAEEIRFDRDTNRHLAFGGGVHRCLGSHLARLELRVALREWHRRIPDYELAPGAELEYSGIIRSIEHLPLVF